MPVTTQAFKSWIKYNTDIRLSSDDVVIRIASEGITTFASLLDFDLRASSTFQELVKSISLT